MLEITPIVVGLLGGLAIFLLGMDSMTEALKAVAGSGMRTVLAKLTGNRFTAAITGAFVTAVIQSSSVTTVLVVGFVSAGVMNLQQSVGVILGANIGTTITAQIIAFKITEYALGLIASGFALTFFKKHEAIAQIGKMLLGLGFIFFGMGLMSDATNPLREHQPFIDFMASLDNPFLGILAGALFTALVQSSSATTGIVIVLAGQGFISLEAGIALALGANIGTSATALLASIGKPRVALQAALVHVIFNLVGSVAWVFFIGVLAELVRYVSPASPDLSGVDRLAAETPRQIANAHTIFNVANTLVFIWLTGPLALIVTKLAPARPAKVPEAARPKYIDEIYLATPALALDQVAMEIGRMGDMIPPLLGHTEPGNARVRAEALRAEAKNISRLHDSILEYTRKLLERKLSSSESDRLEALLGAAGQLHAISDTLALNLATFIESWWKHDLEASEETEKQFRELVDRLGLAIGEVSEAIRTGDQDKARAVIALKPRIISRADALAARVTERLTAPGEKRVELYRYEMSAIELMKRIYYFTKRAAKKLVRDENHEQPTTDSQVLDS